MKLAFYKDKGKLFDKLIRWWTRGKYSHCELVFSDGLFFSASPRDRGVRYKQIEPNPEQWDFVELALDAFDENKVRRWCNSRVGKGYDWWGIVFSQVLPWGSDDPGRYFCSEICVNALQQAGRLKGLVSHTENPNTLAGLYRLT